MKDVNYKSIFFRFLKEKRLYEKWLGKVKQGSWKHRVDLIFKFVKPPEYIAKTICDNYYHYNNQEESYLFREFLNVDFEWRILCYELNKEYKKNLKDFINSEYYKRLPYDSERNHLKKKYEFLKLNEDESLKYLD